MDDQIRVYPGDIESKSKTGRQSDLRYRRFHIKQSDLWGVARYSRVIELAGRDPQKHIASHLERLLSGMSRTDAERFPERNHPVQIPTAPADHEWRDQ